MSEPKLIELLGKKHAVILPDFAAREEIMVSYGEAAKKGGVTLLRVYAATLGLCSRLGREADADYSVCRFDLLTYGGKVYSYLREQGVSPQDIATAAVPVFLQVSETLFPRAVEVEAAEGFSVP